MDVMLSSCYLCFHKLQTINEDNLNKQIAKHLKFESCVFFGLPSFLQAKILEAKCRAKLEFPGRRCWGGGGGAKQKRFPWGEYEYFLEL